MSDTAFFDSIGNFFGSHPLAILAIFLGGFIFAVLTSRAN